MTDHAGSIDDLLRRAAAAFPERTALVSGRETWTWARLDHEAENVADALGGIGVAPGDRVVVLLPKRPAAIAAMFGIFRAAAVYAPLDATAPPSWSVRVAASSRAAAFIATSEGAGVLSDAAANPGGLRQPQRELTGTGLVAGALGTQSMRVQVGADPRSFPDADRLAWIAYTSGSTGTPKGVMHTHASILASARWFTEQFSVGPEDRLAVHPPLHFKMSLEGLLPAALVGATSVLLPLEIGLRGLDLGRLVQRQQVTIWKSVPAPLHALATATLVPGSLPSLRHVIVGGGGWRPADVPAVRALAPRAELWQSYGSTETSTICLHRIEVAAPPGETIPLGLPVDGVTVRMVRPDGSPAPLGTPGELLVSSPKLMRGYWDDPDGTKGVLLARGAEQSGGPWYRTGDMVVALPGGELQFVGRLDQMVKVRGFRVELGQVERALASHPAVVEAVAESRPDPEAGASIEAFVQLDENEATEAALRAYVATCLPRYMVPTRIHLLTRLPRTSTGKVDRVRLMALEAAEAGGS